MDLFAAQSALSEYLLHLVTMDLFAVQSALFEYLLHLVTMDLFAAQSALLEYLLHLVTMDLFAAQSALLEYCCAVFFVALEKKRRKIFMSPNLQGGDILILVQIKRHWLWRWLRHFLAKFSWT